MADPTLGKFSCWIQKARGIYRHVIAAKVAYEIHLNEWDCDSDIMEARASLYIVGIWDVDGKPVFTREAILQSGTVKECVEAAVKDDKENNNAE